MDGARYANPLRIAALAIFCVGAALVVYQVSDADRVIAPWWIIIGSAAGFATAALLILTAVDLIPGVHPKIGERGLLTGSLVSMALLIAYVAWISMGRFDEPVVTVISTMVTVLGLSMFLVLLVLKPDPRFVRPGLLGAGILASAVVVRAIEDSRGSPFSETAMFFRNVDSGLVIAVLIATAAWLHASRPAPWTRKALTLALIGLLLLVLGNGVWEQLEDFYPGDGLFRASFAAIFAIYPIAHGLSGLLVLGVLSRKTGVRAGFGLVALAVVAAIVALTQAEEIRVDYFFSLTLSPIAASVLAIASALAFGREEDEGASIAKARNDNPGTPARQPEASPGVNPG